MVTRMRAMAVDIVDIDSNGLDLAHIWELKGHDLMISSK